MKNVTTVSRMKIMMSDRNIKSVCDGNFMADGIKKGSTIYTASGKWERKRERETE
jgi:hypothetical protein